MANRTAASDPGSRKIAQPPAMPAVARDNIAAAPISSKLSIRNSSPNPSIRFSKSAVSASYVESRFARPVPPVVMIARADPACIASLTTRRTSAGSSFTTLRPTTLWPPATSRSAIARPLVSVSRVRVSLIVSTKQGTDTGDRARCWATDTNEVNSETDQPINWSTGELRNW